MSSGLSKVPPVFCDFTELSGRMGENASVPGNSPLRQVLANWSTYAYKPMSKKK